MSVIIGPLRIAKIGSSVGAGERVKALVDTGDQTGLAKFVEASTMSTRLLLPVMLKPNWWPG